MEFRVKIPRSFLHTFSMLFLRWTTWWQTWLTFFRFAFAARINFVWTSWCWPLIKVHLGDSGIDHNHTTANSKAIPVGITWSSLKLLMKYAIKGRMRYPMVQPKLASITLSDRILGPTVSTKSSERHKPRPESPKPIRNRETIYWITDCDVTKSIPPMISLATANHRTGLLPNRSDK